MGTLRIPDRLARELVAHYITSAPATKRSNEVLRMLISALSELPIERAHIKTGKNGRHADVTVEAEYGCEFTALFAAEMPLNDGTRGTLRFRISGYRALEETPS